MLKRPALLVLDEATSDLDHTTEEKFQRVLEHNFADATILCIAHRIETLRWCRTKIEMGCGALLSISDVASASEDKSSSASATDEKGSGAGAGRSCAEVARSPATAADGDVNLKRNHGD